MVQLVLRGKSEGGQGKVGMVNDIFGHCHEGYKKSNNVEEVYLRVILDELQLHSVSWSWNMYWWSC